MRTLLLRGALAATLGLAGCESVVPIDPPAYTPRLSVMHTYRVDGRVLVRTGTERAGVDW